MLGGILTADEAKRMNLPKSYVGKRKSWVLARVQYEKAASGDVNAAREIADRTEGKPVTSIELKQTMEVKINPFAVCTDEEIELLTRIAQRAIDAGMVETVGEPAGLLSAGAAAVGQVINAEAEEVQADKPEDRDQQDPVKS